MSVEAATWLVRAAQVYLGLGGVFALVFAGALVARVDPAAAQGSLPFRIVILPGAALLWPLLLWRLLAGRRVPVESNAHRDAAQGAGPS